MEIPNGIVFEKVDKEGPIERTFILSTLDGAIFEYARALDTLLLILEDMGLIADAAKNEIDALKTFRLLSPSYLNGPIQIEIVGVLARLAEHKFRPFMTLEEAYSYSKESERIFPSKTPSRGNFCVPSFGTKQTFRGLSTGRKMPSKSCKR